MAQSKNNIVTHGLSGKLGDMLVFSQRAGKTIVGKAPVGSHINTDKQLAVQAKFQQAVIYAKTALTDAAAKEAYKQAAQEGETAYNVAVADLLNAPDIEKIDVSKYTGKPNDIITVTATDDFKVAEVTVAIYNEDGSLVEKGNAQSSNGTEWIYTATAANDNLSGDKIVIQASDLPGNLTEKDEVMK